MKKLLPILIGLSLSGFSTLSRAENLMQVYQQARLSNPELRKSAADRDAAFEKLTKRVVLTAATGFRCRLHLQQRLSRCERYQLQ